MTEVDLVERLRKRAEIRAKLDRGDGKPDRISVQLHEAANEIERLREGFETHGERILTALGNCMHEYGEDLAGQAAFEWVRTFLHTEGNSESNG